MRAPLILLAVAALNAPAAVAQDEPNAAASTTERRVTVEEVEGTSRRTTATMLPSGVVLQNTGEPLPATKITVETQIPIVIQVDLPQSKTCGAELVVSYFQKGDVASVEGELNNAVCAASSGEYTLGVTINDANRQVQMLEFSETWQRTDDQTVTFKKEYPIGADVDLLRVRARRITCTCAEAPEAAPAE